MIRITTKKDGFRRAGMAHHGTQDYADDHFSAAQLAALRNEALLVVEDIDGNDGNSDGAGNTGGQGKGKKTPPAGK